MVILLDQASCCERGARRSLVVLGVLLVAACCSVALKFAALRAVRDRDRDHRGARAEAEFRPETIRDRSYYDNLTLPERNLFLIGDVVHERLISWNIDMLPEGFRLYMLDGKAMDEAARSIDAALVQAGLAGAWEAYRALRAMPYRAELLRYMVLWSEGGVYLDGLMALRGPLEWWAAMEEGQTLAVCATDGDSDAFVSQLTGATVRPLWNGAMSAKRRSPVLLESIRLIVQTVGRRSYYLDGEEGAIQRLRHPALGVTGSLLLGYASLGFEDQVRTSCVYGGPRRGVKFEELVLLGFDPELYKQDVRKRRGRDYGFWFKRGRLYKGGDGGDGAAPLVLA